MTDLAPVEPEGSSPDPTPRVLGKKEQAALEKITGTKWTKYGPVAMAALGALPWVGVLFAMEAARESGKSQDEINQALFLWMQEHEGKFRELGMTLNEIFNRFESFGERIQERINSEEYISLVKKAFMEWDQAETRQKKEMLRKLITNAGGTAIVDDDKVRMFLHWIEKYDELHFKVMAKIYEHKAAHETGITRKQIWLDIYGGEIPQDASSQGNLYTLLVHDLSTGEVICQEREIDYVGRIKNKERGSSKTPGYRKSPFDDTELYELTPLGEEFVRYVIEDLTPQLEGETA